MTVAQVSSKFSSVHGVARNYKAKVNIRFVIMEYTNDKLKSLEDQVVNIAFDDGCSPQTLSVHK